MTNTAAEPNGLKPKKVKQARKSIGASLTVTDAAIFEQRLKEMGLGTAGDLMQTIVKHPGIVDLIKPYAKEHMSYVDRILAGTAGSIEYRLSLMKRCAPEKLEEFMRESIARSTGQRKKRVKKAGNVPL